jgi:hypothetical protein
MIQQMIPSTTIGPNFSMDVRNQVVKKGNSKIFMLP